MGVPDADTKGNEPGEPEERALTPAARRALAEARARREQAERPDRPRELGGRGGEEPVRYGDWEVKGLAVDF